VDRGVRYTQVTAPRGTFPLAGSTSSGLAASEYTQMSPTPARGTHYGFSVPWSSLDHRLRRPKKGSPCTLERKRQSSRPRASSQATSIVKRSSMQLLGDAAHSHDSSCVGDMRGGVVQVVCHR